MTRTQTYAQPQRALRIALTAGALIIAAFTTPAHAAGFDIYGGASGSSQTIHHCGWIQAKRLIYTRTSRNTAIIQRKLSRMGYYTGAIDGVNSPITRAAVMQFQREYGLMVDGIVGTQTATAIGYAGNNAAWVRSCHRPYGTVAMR